MQSFLIPNKLWSFFWRIWSRKLLHKESPDPNIYNNIKKHMCPKRIYCTRTRLWNKKLSHVSNTALSKKTFRLALCQRSQCSNNHRKIPKQSCCTAKIPNPQFMPMMCPKTKYINFRQNWNPLRYTRPSSHRNIWNPKIQRNSSLLPKETSCYKPNSKQYEYRRFCRHYLMTQMNTISPV